MREDTVPFHHYHPLASEGHTRTILVLVGDELTNRLQLVTVRIFCENLVEYFSIYSSDNVDIRPEWSNESCFRSTDWKRNDVVTGANIQ